MGVARMLHCAEEGSTADLLTQSADVLEQDVLPALAGARPSWGLEHVPPRVMLQGTGLEFCCVCITVVTDPVVQEAARVLTAMYVHDVASLQRAINGMMESLQELTARPWTGPGARPR